MNPFSKLSRAWIACLLFLAAVFPLKGEEAPLLVRLTTETERIPVYLAPMEATNSDFDSAYSLKLLNVLQFDLDHNGMTYVFKSSPPWDKLPTSASFDQAPKTSDWDSLRGPYYLVKIRFQGKQAAVRLFSQNGGLAKTIEGISLTGDLSKDRRQIHLLADAIHKTLFGTDGVASTKILYTLKLKKDASLESEVWQADYDGYNAHPITTNSGYSVMPLYIPSRPGYHSGAFFFISYKTGQPKIYYQGFKEGVARRLTYLKGNQLMPAISRQRDKLAFISDVTGNPDLFIQPFSPDTGAIGKPYQIFSTHLATQGSPTFSPDGNQIAFVSNKDGSPRIYVMDVPAPGTSLNAIKASLVTKRNRESTAPCWSPDGSKLAYCSVVQGVRQIWVYDFNTREEKQITQGLVNKENPTWAPNSRHLIFNSSDKGSCDLYLINLNQTDATKITSGPGEKRFPCWEPLISL